MKVPLPERALAFVQRWHGLYISWALVYTFWFHPTEGVPAILTGFFYMFLLFTQMSVANTRWHFVVGWITVLELLVGLHGPAIALINTNNGWPMFLFGFLFMFVFTQQFGFKLPWWVRALIFAAYAAGAVYVYGVPVRRGEGPAVAVPGRCSSPRRCTAARSRWSACRGCSAAGRPGGARSLTRGGGSGDLGPVGESGPIAQLVRATDS